MCKHIKDKEKLPFPTSPFAPKQDKKSAKDRRKTREFREIKEDKEDRDFSLNSLNSFYSLPSTKIVNDKCYLPDPTIAIYDTIVLNYNTSEIHIKFSYGPAVIFIQFVHIITLIE